MQRRPAVVPTTLTALALLLGGVGCSQTRPSDGTAATGGSAIEAQTSAAQDEAPLNLTGVDEPTAEEPPAVEDPWEANPGEEAVAPTIGPTTDVAPEPATTVAPEPEPTPTRTEYDLADLPEPGIKRILPSGLPQVSPSDALFEIAVPYNMDTAGFASPDDSQPPVVRLDAKTDLGNGGEHASWAVVGEQPGWVEVLLPVGRGALASQDPSQVNHHAVWVHAEDVQVTPAAKRIVVDIAAHMLSVYDVGSSTPDVTIPVGVGIAGETPTPRGLCAVSGHITTQAGARGLVTSCQSEVMDSFKGSSYAATAIHQGTGFSTTKGGYVSNGCVRVPGQKFLDYLNDIPTGTVVVFE